MIGLEIGEKVIHYVDDIEAYRMFEIIALEPSGRCVLKGIDTTTCLSRYLNNDINDKRFNYIKVDSHE